MDSNNNSQKPIPNPIAGGESSSSTIPTSPFNETPRPMLTTEEVQPTTPVEEPKPAPQATTQEEQEPVPAFQQPQDIQQENRITPPPPPSQLNLSGNKRKMIAGVMGVLVLVGSTIAGVVLVKQNQNVTKKAAGVNTIECPFSSADNRIVVKFASGYIRSDKEESAAKQNPVSTFIPAGNYKVTLVSFEEDHPNSQTQPKESWFVKLNNSQGATFMQTGAIADLPDGDTVKTQEVNSSLTISQDATAVLPYHSAFKDTSSPNSITPVCAAFEKIEETVESSCSSVIAYDKDWNTLSSNALSKLKAGDIVRFSVSGTTTKGNFDKAKFKINGQDRTEVSTKRPGTNEFYDEYTIPSGVDSFTVSAQVHHSDQNKWY